MNLHTPLFAEYFFSRVILKRHLYESPMNLFNKTFFQLAVGFIGVIMISVLVMVTVGAIGGQ